MSSNPRHSLGATGQAETFLRTAIVTLTDAQIRALKATPQLIAPAPGADGQNDRISIPVSFLLLAHFEVVYTAALDFEALFLAHDPTDLGGTQVASFFNAGADTPLNTFLTNGNGSTDHLTRIPLPQGTYAADWGETTAANAAKPVSRFKNRGLYLGLDAAAEFSGGNAANTLTIILAYMVLDLS